MNKPPSPSIRAAARPPRLPMNSGMVVVIAVAVLAFCTNLVGR